MSKDNNEVELFLNDSSKAIITYEGDYITKITYEISSLEDYNVLKKSVDSFITDFIYQSDELIEPKRKGF